MEIGSTVFTPLGMGRIVFRLPDGSVLVEFDGGWGHLFRLEEVFSPTEGEGCQKPLLIAS